MTWPSGIGQILHFKKPEEWNQKETIDLGTLGLGNCPVVFNFPKDSFGRETQ